MGILFRGLEAEGNKREIQQMVDAAKKRRKAARKLGKKKGG